MQDFSVLGDDGDFYCAILHPRLHRKITPPVHFLFLAFVQEYYAL
jgi:hypothetical protein